MNEKEIYKKVGQFSIVKSGENSTVIDNSFPCFICMLHRISPTAK